MTTAIDTTTTIAAPPDAVWAALTDWSLAPRWMPGVTAMSGPVSPGAVVTFTVRGKERTALVDTLDAPRTLALLSRSGPVTALYTYTLSGSGDRPPVADVPDRSRLRLADVVQARLDPSWEPSLGTGRRSCRSIAREDGVQPGAAAGRRGRDRRADRCAPASGSSSSPLGLTVNQVAARRRARRRTLAAR